MISVDEALDRIYLQLDRPATETVPLAAAHRRVLAEPLRATHSQPPFDASAMDGYAVRAAEVLPGRPMRLAGTAQAGQRFAGMMERGQCVRIFTGAPLPIGADAVIMQEQARAEPIQARLGRTLRWEHVAPLEGRATKVPTAPMATLRIDAGRTDKLRPGDIVGALTGDAGLHKDAIGKIDVYPTRSYVAIARNQATKALQALRAGKIKGRRFRTNPVGD